MIENQRYCELFIKTKTCLDGAESTARTERALTALDQLHGRRLETNDEDVTLDNLFARVRVDCLEDGHVEWRVLEVLVHAGLVAVEWHEFGGLLRCPDETQGAAVHQALDRIEEEATDGLQIGGRRVLHLQTTGINAEPGFDALGIVGAVGGVARGYGALQLAQFEYLVDGTATTLRVAFVQASSQVESSASDQRLLVVVRQIAHRLVHALSSAVWPVNAKKGLSIQLLTMVVVVSACIIHLLTSKWPVC